ncbi:3-oxoacyl-ACP reductase [Agrilactobacillus composti DSM 18527 = JCM 14202]|uniref:3-oxoacyl-ACP reductase n=2 Tax=Agrilactobacillus TaxID=2767875 RepID=A0A0R1XVB4_9LACO|nr:3-oxoacyl-ACP reductase [Agrilactobacillus composti DSM 18527 = JCM 14202]
MISMNRTVLITGASEGLGAKIAQAYGAQGYNVIVNYFQNETAANEVVASIGNDQALALQADVRDKAQVAQLVASGKARFDRIDTVVNNALVGFKFDPVAQKKFEDLTWADHQTQLDGTLKGAFNVISSVYPILKTQKYGRIVNIGTNLFQNPVVPYHEYTTAKAALLGMTRNLAAEFGQYGITVNMVSGGLLKTTRASAVTTPEVFQMIAQSTPLQKVTTPDDVAQVVVFVGSEKAGGLTGQNITVDGGLTMN